MDLIKSKLTSALRHLPTILVALVFLSTFDPVMALVFPQPKHNEPNVQKEKVVKKSEITIGQTYFDEGTDYLDVVREHKDEVVVEEKKPEPPKADEIFKAVEQMPRYPGGEAALMADISKNIRYPAMAAENNIQGCVVVQFVVEKNGSVGQVKVVRGKDPDLDKEAMRVCKTLKKFNPGKMNGVNVRVWYTLPIIFKLPRNEYNNQEAVKPEELLNTMKVTEINITADEEVKEEIIDYVTQEEMVVGVVDFDEGTDYLDVVREHKDEVVVEEKKPEPPKADEIFKAVEQMPRYPGGEAALMADISKNIRYPAMAAENNIQGCVVVQFVVEKNGSVGQVKVVRGKDPDLDKEAMRVCKTLKKFNPGKMNGVNVRVWYTLPINFKLQSNEINGHAYVDLGLSVKWATCNVGADKPEEYGNYFAWGEIAPKQSYTKGNSVTYGKNFSDIGGDRCYDAVRANCGGTWR